jgi:kinetochore-associated protein 1
LEASGDEDINTLSVKIITEGQPDLRLARMLRRGKYDEARNFAAAFNLDPETVYKEQVKGLMGKLDVWQSGTDDLQKTFEEMINYLNKIKVIY